MAIDTIELKRMLANYCQHVLYVREEELLQ